MTPFRFGPEDRTLFGAFHAAEGPGAREEGVLLCGPFGQEGVRIARFMRVLAERLARNGMAVLRFDYFGTGDSSGDDVDGDLVGWTRDIACAHAELLRRSAARRVTWIGARLGATLAIRGARAAGIRRLILWEPIIDGARYLDDLRQRHDAALRANFGPSFTDDSGDAPGSELLGFALSPRLTQQLRALGPGLLSVPEDCAVQVLLSKGASDARRWVEAERSRGARIEPQSLDVAFDWTSDEAMNTALVPPEALSLLVRLSTAST